MYDLGETARKSGFSSLLFRRNGVKWEHGSLTYGVIAQLIRALPLQGRGPGFESQLLHHGDIAQLVRARH